MTAMLVFKDAHTWTAVVLLQVAISLLKGYVIFIFNGATFSYNTY